MPIEWQQVRWNPAPDLEPCGRKAGKRTKLAARQPGGVALLSARALFVAVLVALSVTEIVAGDSPGLALALLAAALTGGLTIWVEYLNQEVRELRSQVAAQQALTENLTQEVRQTVQGWQEAFAAEREIPW